MGNRVQHALRAYTPRDEKAVKSAAQTFRPNPNFDTAEVITNLKTGEALVSFLDNEGKPSIVERTLISPPRSLIGTLAEEKRNAIIANSPMFYKYENSIDRESAYEIISKKYDEISKSLEEAQKLKEQEDQAKLQEKERIALEKLQAKERKEREKAKRSNPFNKVAKTTMSTITGDLGRSIARGLLGNIKKMF